MLTYNIHHGNPPGHAEKIDLEAIAEVIRKSGATLVALQEVDVNTERSGKSLHQMKELAKLTGMDWHFFKSIDHQGGEYGNGILTSLPIVEKGGFSLPFQEGTEPRGAAYVKVSLSDAKSQVFVSTHLDFTNDSNTLMQAKRLNEYFLREKEPLIVAGDFNSEPNAEPIAYFKHYYELSCQGKCPATFPQDNPTKTIDYIFFRKDNGLKVIDHNVIEETYASDHRPVIATFEIGG